MASFARLAWCGWLIVAGSVGSAAEPASEWSQFLGPHRNGVAAEAKPAPTWPAGGPKVLWRAPLGVGMSGIAVGNHVVTLAHREGRQTVVAHDPRTGELVRAVAVAPVYRNAMGDGPRATPTLDGDSAYVFTGEGILAKVDLGNGRVEWQHDVPRELGGKPAEYGMASSPLLDEGRVVVIAGVPGATVVAFDAKTGELAWKSGDDPCGYSSPMLLEAGGRLQIVAFTGNSVLGLDRRTGEVLWRYPFVTEYRCNTASPIAVDGKVFVSAGESHGSVLLDVSGPKPKTVWESLGPKSVLRSEWQTPILLDGYLYNFDNVGSAGPVTHLTCLEAATGKRVWQQPRFGKGNLIAAGGMLMMTMFDGSVVAVEASPKAFVELGRIPVLGRTRQTPSLSAGRLYVRDDRELVCLELTTVK